MGKIKLVTVIMGQNCLKFIEMAYQSVKDSDAVVFCDGGSKDGTIEYLKEEEFKWEPGAGKKSMIFQRFDPIDKQANGKQRNYYLEYLKKKYPNDWCLVIDADEVVEDIDKVKDFVQNAAQGIYSVKMRHFIGDLGHEDNTRPIHFVPNRLFKISEAVTYPLHSHPVLEGKVIGAIDLTTIWHLGHLPVEYMKYIQNRYDQHSFDSVIHDKKFLEGWRDHHLYGTYPKKQICTDEIPDIILKECGIDPKELYFDNRKDLDIKHFLDAIYLKEFIGDGNVIYFGCGMGMRVWVSNKIGMKTHGNEISEYAVKESYDPESVRLGDITKGLTKIDKTKYRMSVAYDVLEHLKYNDLGKGIKTLIDSTEEYVLVSVPYRGTPNCDADKTHIIKEDRDWWIKQFTDKGLKLIKTPDHFLFKEQILIFKK